MKFIKIVYISAGILLSFYFFMSWGDILAHQMSGSVAAWNLFVILIKFRTIL